MDPRRGWPSGHFGVGCICSGIGGGVMLTVKISLPAAVTTDFAQICRLLSRAAIPLTATLSPGCSVVRSQPFASRSIGLSSSTAQLLTFSPVATFTKMCACGLRQSTSDTTPRILTGFLSSNLANGSWCAAIVAEAATMAAQPKAKNFFTAVLF